MVNPNAVTELLAAGSLSWKERWWSERGVLEIEIMADAVNGNERFQGSYYLGLEIRGNGCWVFFERGVV